MSRKRLRELDTELAKQEDRLRKAAKRGSGLVPIHIEDVRPYDIALLQSPAPPPPPPRAVPAPAGHLAAPLQRHYAAFSPFAPSGTFAPHAPPPGSCFFSPDYVSTAEPQSRTTAALLNDSWNHTASHISVPASYPAEASHAAPIPPHQPQSSPYSRVPSFFQLQHLPQRQSAPFSTHSQYASAPSAHLQHAQTVQHLSQYPSHAWAQTQGYVPLTAQSGTQQCPQALASRFPSFPSYSPTQTPDDSHVWHVQTPLTHPK